MGVSSRMVHAVEPRAGDLLMPERNRRVRAARIRDVEDACFETIGVSADRLGKRAAAVDAKRVFKSRLVQAPSEGPFPPDFAASDNAPYIVMAPGERLGVFGAGAAGGGRQSRTGPALAMAVCVVAAAVFWMAGGSALLLKPAAEPAVKVETALPVDVLQAGKSIADAPDPVVTSSIPVQPTSPAKVRVLQPAPGPARIERAGSILMIRPGGG